MTDTNYNIAIIGQTGVGKSALINYLFGEKVVESGIGRPVTANGFHVVHHQIKDMPVKIYDSWGLEVGKEEQWQNELTEELKSRGVDKPSSEWFHSIFYCIAASGARIQDADIEIIKKLLGEKFKVSVILTKADAINESEEEIFIQEIKKLTSLSLSVIPVCSESKKTRGGEINPFGKEEVENQSVKDLLDSLIVWVPEHCKYKMVEALDAWVAQKKTYVIEEMGIFTGKDKPEIQNELAKGSKQLVTDINKIFEEEKNSVISHYKFIAEKLSTQLNFLGAGGNIGIEHQDYNISDDWWESAKNSIIAIFNINDSIKELQKIIEKFELEMRRDIDKKVKGFTGDLKKIGGIEEEVFVSDSDEFFTDISEDTGSDGELSQNAIIQALDFAYDKAVNGVIGLDSAQELADDYLQGKGTLTERVNSLIRWQNTKAGTSGFVAGLGGLLLMPVTLPANITSVLYVQVRMIAAIAIMAGHDVADDRVKAMVYACLAGNAAKDILKDAGIVIGTKMATNAIKGVSAKTLTVINQKVGFRLLTKFGETGVVNLGKMVPVLGGIVGMTFDSIATNVVGNVARDTFIYE